VGVARTLAVRAIMLLIVLYGVLLLTSTIIGASGLSDTVLEAIVKEKVRAFKQAISARITNETAIQQAVKKYEESLAISYGLDKPWYVRIPRMIYNIMVLDLGTSRAVQSFSGSNRIADIVMERLPNTVYLVTTAVLVSSLSGLALGLWASLRAGKIIDRFVGLGAAISYALPTWWLGMILILIFAYQLRLFPPGGMKTPGLVTDNPVVQAGDLVWHLALPLTSLYVALVGSWTYITRAIIVSITKEDFVFAGMAKGLPENIIRRRYLLRPSASPILTNMIIGLAGSIAGAILTETVFSWPGMGSLYLSAINAVDVNLILALTFIYTLVYVIARFLLEVIYIIIDPRVRL